jgi:hypothetical protein
LVTTKSRDQTQLTSVSTRPVLLSNTPVVISAKPLGQLAALPADDTVLAAKKFFATAKTSSNRILPTPLTARSGQIPENLRPKQPKLSAAQKQNLAKLHWGPSKSLRYSGDPLDATVRLLAAPALLLPLDSEDPSAEPPEALTRRFLNENRNLLLIEDPAAEFALIGDEPDPEGGTILRFGQKLGQYEVWPGQITANVSAAGYLRVVSGAYAPTPKQVATTPKITAEAAQTAALAHAGLVHQPKALATDAPSLKIFADKSRTPELSYEVFVEFGHRHERVFVSAQSGEILHSVSEICTGSVAGSGTDIFGQTRPLNVVTEGTPTRYYLVDTSKPMYDAASNRGIIAIIDPSSLSGLV